MKEFNNINIKFNNCKESEKALDELSKLKLMTMAGRSKEQKVYISIEKPEVIEVRIYDLSGFSRTTYHRFNRSVRDLFL